jgi:hypothetical protein
MPATRYKVWQWGNAVGKGVTGAFHVGMAGIAKCSNPSMPYTVANELICGYLAHSVLLPIPSGFVMENQGKQYYVSMNFNLSGEDLPPANAKKITDNHPELSWGIILFDILIYNFDRHEENISYDSVARKVQIFDHSHAFIVGHDADSAMGDFERRGASAGIGGHCLARTISTLNGLKHWASRFSLIPDFYISEVVNSAKAVGLDSDLADYAIDFLLDRRTKLIPLIMANRAQFPNLAPGLFDGLERVN